MNDAPASASISAKSGATSKKKLAGDMFSAVGGRLSKSRIVFVQEFVIEILVNNSASALLDFADVDQHPGLRIDASGKNKIGHVVAAGAVSRCALRSERDQIFAFRPARDKKPARCGKFEPFTNRQSNIRHDESVGRLCRDGI